MPEARLRPKNQITLPASVVRQAKIKVNDLLSVSCVNGSIVISPQNASDDSEPMDIMSFAGIGRGIWGETPEEVDWTLQGMRQGRER